jgi:hypothetical protein
MVMRQSIMMILEMILGTFTKKIFIVNDLFFALKCRLKLKSNVPSKDDSIKALYCKKAEWSIYCKQRYTLLEYGLIELYGESDMNNIAILNNIVFTLNAQFSRIFSPIPAIIFYPFRNAR